jgi:hypothetical protein
MKRSIRRRVPKRRHPGPSKRPTSRRSALSLAQSGFLSNFHVSRLCSNSVRTRAARAMGPISLGLAVTFWSVFQRWESSAKPISPRHLAKLSSIFRVRALILSFNPISGHIRALRYYSRICATSIRGTAVSLMLGVATHPQRGKGNGRCWIRSHDLADSCKPSWPVTGYRATWPG